MRRVLLAMLVFVLIIGFCCTAQATTTFGFGQSATIEETVLVDEHDVRITATELTYSYSGIEIELIIENNGSKDLSFHSGTMGYSCNSVNGYMVGDGYLSCDVAAGESEEDSIHISESVLTMLGIREVASIELGFDISDDDYNHFYTGPCKIYTSAHDGYDYSVNTYREAVNSGLLQDAYNFTLEDYTVETLVSENGLSLEAWGIFTNYAGEKQLMFECVNNSDQQVGVRTYRAGLNGLMLYESYTTYDTVNPGCTQIISFPYAYLVEDAFEDILGLSDIGTVSFTLDAVEDDYDYVVNPVEFTFPVGKETAGFDATGTEVFNENGVRVVFKGFFNGHSEYDDELHALFILENTYGEDVNFRFDECFLNGNDVASVGSMVIPNGASAALELTFYSYSFEEFNISTIADVQTIDANVELRTMGYSTIAEGPIATIEVANSSESESEAAEQEMIEESNTIAPPIDQGENEEDISSSANNDVATAASSEQEEIVAAEESCGAVSAEDQGLTYAYLHDKWDLYRATAYGDNMIRIDCWSRAVANDENPFKPDHCIAVIKTDDGSTDFCWVDEAHTSFAVTINDMENSRFEDPTLVIFEIEEAGEYPILESLSGSETITDVRTYTYLHDKWDLYRAAPIGDNLIKIECWSTAVANDAEYPMKLDHTVAVIRTDDGSTDFSWVDDSKSAFTVTINDDENSRFEESALVLFGLGEGNYCYLAEYDLVSGVLVDGETNVFVYLHDKWDLYKASLMSDNLIKIECWNSAIAYDEEYPLEYDHNVLVIKTDDGSTDFSWVNEERTAFTVTMKDEQNSRFEEPALVYFELVDNSND